MEDFCKHLGIARPPLITLLNAITISSTLPQQEITSLHELPDYMLEKIMMLDSTSRQFPQSLNAPAKKKMTTMEKMKRKSQKSDDESSLVHPMDVFLYLFIRCDPIFRQTFITQVSRCQLSIPLITSHSSGQQPTLYLIALKTLYKDYLTKVDIGKSFSVTEEKLPIISFIRVGECGNSQKSEMLNQIIGISDYFFHKNQLGNVKKRYFLDGTVEIAWLLPKCLQIEKSDLLIEPYVILNLRGNAWKYPKQLKFLTSISSIIYIFIPINHCDQDFNERLISFNNEFHSKSVFVLYQNPLPSNFEPILPQFLKDINDTVLFLDKNSLGEDAKNLSLNISLNVKNFTFLRISLDDECKSIARKCSICIDSDEDNIDECQNLVTGMMNRMFSTYPKNTESRPLAIVKRCMLPLQGEYWLKWAEAKRQLHKVGIQEHQDEATKRMSEARNEQLERVKTPSSILIDITNHCRSFGSSQGNFYTIWHLLRNDFNSLSKAHLPQLYEEYKKWHKLSYSTDSEQNLSVEVRNQKQCESKQNLTIAAKDIAESSFGIEHIFRELGQVFEAYSFGGEVQKCEIDRTMDFRIEIFKDIAAKLLIEGHAFEIIDGDVNHMAIKWVSCVLESLASYLGYKKRIFVLSILGTQSTGKSTLLNTMFGANFPVSSGRCTRGIFMQLIPIEEKLRKELRYDYLVILDTEGLRAPELSINSSYRRDNELATIAVGLGDVTIINMSGEGHSEVQDILQIIIFAFIRMKESYSKPRCMFVHQNVPDTHAHTNLISARSNLIKTLDKMTECAGTQENKNPFYKRFADVLEFHPDDEFFYFPGLFEGEPPLNKISTGYSKRASNLRHYLLNCFTHTDKKFQTVTEWSKKLQSLWKAVLEENFVFSYRNALEVTSRFELDHSISSWHSNYIQSLNKWKSDSLNELFNADVVTLEETWKTLSSVLQQEKISPSIEITLQKTLMQYYFVDHENLEVYSQWQANTAMLFTNKREKHVKKMEKEYQMIYDLQKNKKKMDENYEKYRKDIVKKVHGLFIEMNMKGKSLKNNILVEIKFKTIWLEWKSQIEVEKREICDICNDLQKALIDSHIVKNMSVLSIRQFLIQDASKFIAIGKNGFQQLSTFDNKITIKSSYYIWNDLVKKVNIGFGYITNIFSSNHPDPGNNQFKSALSILSTECERNINDYLVTLIKTNTPYDPNYFHIIIDICYNIITKQNRSQNDNFQRSLQFTVDFIFDFLFYQCCKAIPTLQNINDQFITRTSLDLKFTQLEEKLRSIFHDLCEGIQSEYLCASELARITVCGMKDILIDKVPQEFFSAFMDDPINSTIFTDRSSLILRILKDLARDKNFKNYISYIENPMNFLVDYVQKRLKEYSQRKSILKIVLSRMKINTFIEFYKAECNNACKLDLRATTASWMFFKKTFYSKIKLQVRNVSFNDLDVLDVYTISNYSQFNDLFAKELQKIVEQTNWFVWIANILENEVSLYKTITEAILECEELCPFCNELCQLSCGQHEHYCGTFHRPNGINGWRYVDSRVIYLYECTTSIRNKGNFLYQQLEYEYVNYKMVNARFNSWRILGEDAMNSKYWHWVLCQFEQEFLAYYDVKKNSEIKRWKHLTENEVIQDLETHYRCHIFKNV